MRQHETGATLIIVLIFLILIISVGAIAVRQSVTDLKIATNDQVDTLLLNSADSVPNELEGIVNAGGAEFNRLKDATGAFGYFLVANGSNRGDQLIFCYNPRSDKFFSLDKASILTPDGGTKIIGGSGDGYCDSTDPDSYTNARNTNMVQVMITRLDVVKSPKPAFDQISDGRDASLGNEDNPNPLFEVNSVALIPALSNVSDAKINECLNKPSAQPTRFVSGVDGNGNNIPFDQTLSGCLQSEGVPQKPISQEIRMTDTSKVEFCTEFGKSSGALSQQCQTNLQLNADGSPKS